MKDSYFANNNIKTFTDDSKMFGRGKIGKRKLIEAKTKKSRAKVPLIDPQPMQAPPAPASSVDQSLLECQHYGFKYVFKLVAVIMGKPHTRSCFCMANMRL